MRALLNPAVRRDARFRGLFSAGDYAAVEAFYESRPSLPPTRLAELPLLAASLGLGAVMVKDESERFGLSAFKSLGARYAMERLGRATMAAGVVCATAGNHGRAVARTARDMGVPCTVLVPAPAPEAGLEERAVRDARVAGMRADGAEVIDVPGSYEEAVERAVAHANKTGATIISDTASRGGTPPHQNLPDDESVPRDIMAGYTRLFTEASRQWIAPPDVVVVQGGVGGLVCAAASWFAFHVGAERPFLIACEPDDSACLLESARAGGPVRLGLSPRSSRMNARRSRRGGTAFRVPAIQTTIMAGLRCAQPSYAAWPTVRDGVDAFMSIPDSFALRAMESLAGGSGDPRIDAGPSGACGVGALIAVASEPVLHEVRNACGLGRSTRVLAVVTEGK